MTTTTIVSMTVTPGRYPNERGLPRQAGSNGVLLTADTHSPEMTFRLTGVRVVLASVLFVSAGGFVLAAKAERSREAVGVASNAPEGSAAGEERNALGPRTPSTAPTIAGPATTSATIAAPATTSGAAAPEGSPEREAAERSQRAAAMTTPPTTSLSTTATPTIAPPTTVVTARSKTSGEKLLGVSTESSATTAAAVIVLLVSALVAVTVKERRAILGVAVVVGLLALLTPAKPSINMTKVEPRWWQPRPRWS